MKLEDIARVVETDVLIIGGGIAGAMAALGAREFPVDVTLVDKGTFGRSGCAAIASGVWHCYLPGDDFELWYNEYIAAGVPLVDQDLLKKHIRETARIVNKLEQWGVKWVKDSQGKFKRTKASGDSVPRNAMLAEGGPQMMLAIRNEAGCRGVKTYSKIMVTDLITSDGKHPTGGKVIGAIGFHLPTGDVCVFKAKATVLASGGVKMLPYAKAGHGDPTSGGMMPNNITGDGYAMAYRAGVEMTHMENMLGCNGVHLQDLACAPSMNLLFGLGAKFTNRLGDRFMEKYDPLRKESAHRWVVGIAVANEIRQGRGPITLDCTHFTAEDIKLCKAVIPIIMENLEKAGCDITRDKIAYEADYAGSIVGSCGLTTNADYETSLPGLYAAGAATTSLLSALPGCSITGWHAGQNAAESSMAAAPAEITTQVARQVGELRKEILTPLTLKEGMSFEQAKEEVKSIIKEDIGIFHNEEGLKKAAGRLSALLTELPNVVARDYHDLSRVIGIKNLVTTLDMGVASALRRTESRTGFVRDDYPETDNANWLKAIRIKRKGAEKRDIWEEPLDILNLPLKHEKTRHIAFAGRS